MITMENWAAQAVNKLTSEQKAVSGARVQAMAPAVLEVLKSFCLQDQEFAQAVAQGGTFSACMRAVVAGVGSSISDLEAYEKAVRFYFPGAKIHMQMTIDLVGDAAHSEPSPEAPKENSDIIVLDLMAQL